MNFVAHLTRSNITTIESLAIAIRQVFQMIDQKTSLHNMQLAHCQRTGNTEGAQELDSKIQAMMHTRKPLSILLATIEGKLEITVEDESIMLPKHHEKLVMLVEEAMTEALVMQGVQIAGQGFEGWDNYGGTHFTLPYILYEN